MAQYHIITSKFHVFMWELSVQLRNFEPLCNDVKVSFPETYFTSLRDTKRPLLFVCQQYTSLTLLLSGVAQGVRECMEYTHIFQLASRIPSSQCCFKKNGMKEYIFVKTTLLPLLAVKKNATSILSHFTSNLAESQYVVADER